MGGLSSKLAATNPAATNPAAKKAVNSTSANPVTMTTKPLDPTQIASNANAEAKIRQEQVARNAGLTAGTNVKGGRSKKSKRKRRKSKKSVSR